MPCQIVDQRFEPTRVRLCRNGPVQKCKMVDAFFVDGSQRVMYKQNRCEPDVECEEQNRLCKVKRMRACTRGHICKHPHRCLNTHATHTYKAKHNVRWRN